MMLSLVDFSLELNGLEIYYDGTINLELKESLINNYCNTCNKREDCQIIIDLERRTRDETFKHTSLIVLSEVVDAFTEEWEDVSYRIFFPVCFEYRRDQQMTIPGLEHTRHPDYLHALLRSVAPWKE